MRRLVCFFVFTSTHFCAFAGYDVNGKVFSDEPFSDDDFDGNYRYRHCGGVNSVILLKELKATPKVFVIPQNISISISFKLLRDILPPITISIKIAKKLPLFGYVHLPCIANYGSCTYTKACKILETYPKDSFEYNMACPNWFQATGIGCKCPFKAGVYTSNNVSVAIETDIVPKWIATGDYRSTLIIEDQIQTVGCFNFQFRLI